MGKKKGNNIVVTGGKTGGHIYPALAIADILSDDLGAKPFYIGAKDGMEAQVLKNELIPFYGLALGPLVGISFFGKIKNMLKNIGSFFKSFSILGKIKPRLIIGTGGFVCGPVLAAAYFSRIPIIIHEQNVEPGMTNRLLSHIAKEIWMTFNESASFFPKGKKKILTGMPLRASFQKDLMTKKEAKAHFKFTDNDKVLLVTGGSQGSRVINKNIMESYKDIIEILGYKIIHITGPALYDEVVKQLKVTDNEFIKENKLIVTGYMNEMDIALQAADIAIGRSGASFICELISLSLFSIQVPLKTSAGNHQLKNAKVLEKVGLAKVIKEDELIKDSFYLALASLQMGDIHTIIKNKVGILYGQSTIEIIRRESEKYLR